MKEVFLFQGEVFTKKEDAEACRKAYLKPKITAYRELQKKILTEITELMNTGGTILTDVIKPLQDNWKEYCNLGHEATKVSEEQVKAVTLYEEASEKLL